jgi:hypothetical protein
MIGIVYQQTVAQKPIHNPHKAKGTRAQVPFVLAKSLEIIRK